MVSNASDFDLVKSTGVSSARRQQHAKKSHQKPSGLSTLRTSRKGTKGGRAAGPRSPPHPSQPTRTPTTPRAAGREAPGRTGQRTADRGGGTRRAKHSGQRTADGGPAPTESPETSESHDVCKRLVVCTPSSGTQVRLLQELRFSASFCLSQLRLGVWAEGGAGGAGRCQSEGGEA